MFALAPDAQTARTMLLDGEPEGGLVEQDLFESPEVWDTAQCMKVWGGG